VTDEFAEQEFNTVDSNALDYFVNKYPAPETQDVG